MRSAGGSEEEAFVVGETWVALNAAKFDEIIEACESKGVQFMDGTMWVQRSKIAKMSVLIWSSAFWPAQTNMQLDTVPWIEQPYA